MALILSKVDEVKKRTHRFRNPGGDIRVASNYGEKNALQIFRFLPGMLSESSESISEMPEADARLQN